MVGRARIAAVGIVFAVALAAPRPARAGVELSARVPVGLSFGDGTKFELGLRSDLLYLFRDLGLGLSGEVRSVSFSQRAQEIGAMIAWIVDDREPISISPAFDAGYGTEGSRGYAFGRLSLQLRAHIDARFGYAATSAIFVGARKSVSGPGGTEGIVGVELGGGLIASWLLLATAFGHGG